MKKIIVFSLLVTGMIFSAQAQDIAKNTIGLRLGGSDGFGAEISYQRGLTENNRLEFGLGWRDSDDFNAFRVSGLYQWVFHLDGSFNWYAGAGGGFGSVDFDDNIVVGDDSETFLFIAGSIGIEYDFEIPLLISLDFRPEINFGDINDNVDFDVALGIRYQF